MPDVLDRLTNIVNPKTDPNKQFVGTYDPPITQMATIDEGLFLQRLFLQEIPKFRKVPVGIQAVNLLAQSIKSGLVTYIPVNEMIDARFPADKPIKLFIEVEQGRKQTGDEGMDPAANVEETVGQIMFNVYEVLAERVILASSGNAISLKNTLTADPYGLKGISEAIDNAYNVGAAIPPPPPQPAVEAKTNKK